MAKVKLVLGQWSEVSFDPKLYEFETKEEIGYPNSKLLAVGIKFDKTAPHPSSVEPADEIDTFTPILYEDVNNLVGKLLTLIDATFGDSQQRKAQKDIAQQILWDWYHDRSHNSSGLLRDLGGHNSSLAR